MMKRILSVLLMAAICVNVYSPIFAEETFAPCGEDAPCEEAASVEGAAEISVENISYDDFKRMLDSGEEIILLDARPADAFNIGHIPGAQSFPMPEMNEQTAAERLVKEKKIIVYCQSETCSVSHNAAVKLITLGYDVKDYHGGVNEWITKGNELAK